MPHKEPAACVMRRPDRKVRAFNAPFANMVGESGHDRINHALSKLILTNKRTPSVSLDKKGGAGDDLKQHRVEWMQINLFDPMNSPIRV